MKGVSILQDMFLLIFLIAIIVILTLFVWVLIITFQAESRLAPGGLPTTRNVEMTLIYRPIDYDAIMSAFLENEYSGIKIKRLLNAVAIQEDTTVWLDGKMVDVKQVSENILNQQIKRDYILKVDDFIVASRGMLSTGKMPMEIQKTYTIMFLLNGEESYLQLFVAD